MESNAPPLEITKAQHRALLALQRVCGATGRTATLVEVAGECGRNLSSTYQHLKRLCRLGLAHRPDGKKGWAPTGAARDQGRGEYNRGFCDGVETVGKGMREAMARFAAPEALCANLETVVTEAKAAVPCPEA
jgi:DNA-binding IclR family transcriptional regulator